MTGIIGIFAIILICVLLSSNKKLIVWKTVVLCLLAQFIFAWLVLKVPFVMPFFDGVSSFFVKVLEYTSEGSRFLFGSLMDTKSYGFIFAFQVLPTIVFFSALTSLFYYLGVLQLIVYGFAWIFTKTLKLSGSESLSTAGNIFLGQTEAPLLVKPYIAQMSRSELLCIMIGGMANIAGGVLAAYVGFLGGDDPVQRQAFATHLLCASIMSAPATILISKILEPELHPENLDHRLQLSKDNEGQHIFEAISNGTTDGVTLAINVAAMLLVFTALMAMGNSLLGGLGSITGLNTWIAESSHGVYSVLSFQYVLGQLFSPLAWAMGVDSADLHLVGRLLGEKTILNEFYAYGTLGQLKAADAFTHEKSMIIATYALCGFANFSSIGIQLGGIGAMAPNQRPVLAKLGLKALIGGTFCTLLTASIVGLFY